MRLSLDLCGRLADPYGSPIQVRIAEVGCNVAALRQCVAQQWPLLAEAIVSPRVRACVAEQLAEDAAWVMPDQTAAFFPPVSGG